MKNAVKIKILWRKYLVKGIDSYTLDKAILKIFLEIILSLIRGLFNLLECLQRNKIFHHTLVPSLLQLSLI